MMRVGLVASLLALGTAVVLHAQSAPFASEGLLASMRGEPRGRLEQALPFGTLNGFVENRGQWPAEVKFFASRGGIDATLLQDAIVLRPQPDAETGEWPAPVVLRFSAANSLEGQGALPTAHHFIRADGSASYVPGFDRVTYRDIAPGIDLVVRADGRWFAYDLHVAPGADLGGLKIDVEGVDCPEVLGDGLLVVQTAAGPLEQRIGAAWETDSTGARMPVTSGFRLLDASAGRLTFGFEAPGRNASRAFVLDPSLVWSTYVGGSSQELVRDVAVSPGGSVYLGVKSSSSGPTTPGAFQTIQPGGSNAWVGKLSADGSTLEWATFLGGSQTEDVVGVAVDAEGHVVVLGDTWSTDFPITANTIQPAFAGQNDMFLSRLTPDGSVLSWSTFYGGPENDHASAVALFPSGEVLIAGMFDVPGPPATTGAFDTVFDIGDQFLSRISAEGTQTAFLTYFSSNTIHDVECDEHGIVLAGLAGSSLPTTRGAFQEELAPGDVGSGFVARMDPLGSLLTWATFLGGDAGADTIYGIDVDAAGAIYAAGQTLSSDFPVTSSAFDLTSSNDGGDGYVAKLLPGGTGLVWSTYISACCGGVTLQWDIAVDKAGNAISVGSSNEPTFPTTSDAFQPTYIGGFTLADAHLTKFDAFGETLVYSTYFGAAGSDNLPVVGLDAAQDPVIALRSSSTMIPVTPGSYDASYNGGTDTVVAKFDLELLPWLVLGGGLPGAVDTPNLAGTGALKPGSPARLSVRGAAPLAPASLIAGLSAGNLAFKGGTMVPFPAFILSLATNAQGSLDLPFTWVNAPAGIPIWIQFWIKDVGAASGFSATNALRMTTQ